MARRKTSSKSRKRSKTKRFKLSFKATVILLILGFIVAGVWAYFHPYEARQYVQTWIDQLQGKPTTRPIQPAQPIPTVEGSKYDNLALGIPGAADTIVDREGYSLGYSEEHEQAMWVVYRLTAEEVKAKEAKRDDSFKEDPAIPTGSATLADYRHSNYDRGHLAPAADMGYSVQTMQDSFYMSNMSPQAPDFNRGVWKLLEEQVRSFAVTESDIYIVTGPVLPKTKTEANVIGANEVTVPSAYYKVIYDRTPPEKMLGFVLPNEGSNHPLKDFAVTVDKVEAMTGLNFFSELPSDKQEQLESTITINAWPWN